MQNAKTYLPQLLCSQPTRESDQIPFFPRNALTLVPRNNLARYNRLPESCSYATGLDPAEMTFEAAEMCAEQKDWHRALVALDKYAKVGKANARSEGLRAQAEKSILGTR
jgi:hypothetical protein